MSRILSRWKMQTILADAYHTTKKADAELAFDGKQTLVGIDLTPKECPGGRFIFFCIDNPINGGTVLFGTTFCDFRVADQAKIRAAAIEIASRRLGSAQAAEDAVDRVIASGGMVLVPTGKKKGEQ